VQPGTFEAAIPTRPGTPLTYLYFSRQVHAETNQIHTHSVVRLDTMDAVQHESQWRLQLEPRTQNLVIHWIRILRGPEVREHAHPDRFRILQREEGLEGFIIDGWFTVLLLLEDVRPGDILDSCFTVQSRPKLLPERFSAFFSLPAALPVAKYCFHARFAASRPVRWKSSGSELTPVVSRVGEDTTWTWSGLGHSGMAAEPNTPEWYMAYPWVQVSDFQDWGSIAAALAEAWPETPEDPEVLQIVKDIGGHETDPASRVGRAVRFIQDEHRYLSVDLELGGHVPAPPGIVARRRYGDCKDVSFLLVHLLRGLGVKSRPILVNTRLRKSLQDLLPSPGLFNHVVVEYELNGQLYWVDSTLRGQGGSSLNPMIPDYGTGLAVDPAAAELALSPRGSDQQSVYELRESLLLDTIGRPSLLAVVLRATGFYAEGLRQQFSYTALSELERERLQICTNRFGSALRLGELKHRDDRNANEFYVAETFEVRDFLQATEDPETLVVLLGSHLITGTLGPPDQTPRKTPLGLPYPCNLVHTVEIQVPGLQMNSSPRQNLSNPFLRYSRTHKVLSNYWSITWTLSTLQDSVSAPDVAKHRDLMETIRGEAVWQVPVPAGAARVLKRPDFGALPPPNRKSPSATGKLFEPAPAKMPVVLRKDFQLSTAAVVLRNDDAAMAAAKTRRAKRRRDRKRRQVVWVVMLIITFIGLVAAFFLAAH
jgi:transglutaminase-like putative cysteine protease